MLVCRTCLTRKDLSPLFGDPFAAKFDSFQLFNATGLQINENDGLPQLACKSCIRSIRKVLNFREIARKSEETLKCIAIDSDIKTFQDHESIYDDVIKGTESENPFFYCLDSSDNDNDCDNDSRQNITSKMYIEKFKNASDNFEVPISNGSEKNIKTFEVPLTKAKTETAIKSNCTSKTVIKTKKFNTKRKRTRDLSSQNDVTIEDFESTDSEPEKLNEKRHDGTAIWTTEGRIAHSVNKYLKNKNQSDTKKSYFVKRKMSLRDFKEKNETYMALAVKPYTRKGPVECKECQKVLIDKASFITHAKTHFEPEFSCEECGKKFHSRNHMGYHQQRRHGSVKRLACTQCGYRAVDRTTLLNHVRLEHTGERPYICAECGLSFRMRRAIAQHMRTHFGVKNQQCDRCPAMFKSHSQLWTHQDRVHLMTHTYPCYLCSDTYKSRQAVKKHLLNAHGLPIEQQLKVECVKVKK